jgi:DUF4097 and DUF4098 domain-containing protein YvlB
MSEQHFTTPQPVQLEIKIASGDIEIATVDGDRSTVTLDGPQKLLDAISVDLVGDRLTVEQDRKAFAGIFERFDEGLRVVAHVPHCSGVTVATASADATLDGTFGGVAMTTASGDVRVSGEVDGDARTQSASGDARLCHVAGDLAVQTVSGDLVVASVDGSATLRSVSGDVHVGSLREGQVSVNSVSGDIELGIVSGSSVDIDAGSLSGDLSSEVALSDEAGHDEGPTVVIRSNTVSGDFRIFRAA